MNDEDFARQAFAAAFRSGGTGEPPTLPDVEGLASRGRRAARYRHGTYAAGTTALAGVVTAGIVTGPALLGLSTNSGSHTVSAGGGGAASTSVPSSAKPSAGVPCTSTAIDWLAVVSAALPTGVTATPDHSANCVQLPDGTRTYEALFKLSTGQVGLQVDVGTGPEIARKLAAGTVKPGIGPGNEAPESVDPSTLATLRAKKLAVAACESSAGAALKIAGAGAAGAAPSGSPEASLDPAAIASLQAQKQAFASAVSSCGSGPDTAFADAGSAAGSGSGSASLDPSLDPAAIASLDAKKRALASAEATASSGTEGSGKPDAEGTCSSTTSGDTTCVSHVSKGPASVVQVQLLRGGSNPILIDIEASNGKGLSTPATDQLPTDATMVAIAEAVATHF